MIGKRTLSRVGSLTSSLTVTKVITRSPQHRSRTPPLRCRRASAAACGALFRTQIWDTNLPIICNTSGVPVLNAGRRRVMVAMGCVLVALVLLGVFGSKLAPLLESLAAFVEERPVLGGVVCALGLVPWIMVGIPSTPYELVAGYLFGREKGWAGLALATLVISIGKVRTHCWAMFLKVRGE
eukprot:SAG31_NODE_761_length_12276_cov_4.530673_3_plen_182_part_00